MRRAYVVVGLNPETNELDQVYDICHTMSRADELCLEAESETSALIFTWYEAVEEDD